MTAPWIDLVDPTREDLRRVADPPLPEAAIELLAAPPSAAAEPLLERHDGFVLAVLLHARVPERGNRAEYVELDVVVRPAGIVTVRKTDPGGVLAPVDGIAARVDAGAVPGSVFQAAVDDAADAFLGLLDGLYESIDDLENDVDRLSGADVRQRIALLRNELLRARRASTATRGIARRVVDGRVDVGQSGLFPREVEAQFVDTYETLVRVTEELDVARDLLGGVRDYYQAKIAEQQNEVGKKLTVVASLVLVPSFIVGFYGQNFAGQFREGYWSVGVSVGLILLTTVIQLALFRWRRWL